MKKYLLLDSNVLLEEDKVRSVVALHGFCGFLLPDLDVSESTMFRVEKALESMDNYSDIEEVRTKLSIVFGRNVRVADAGNTPDFQNVIAWDSINGAYNLGDLNNDLLYEWHDGQTVRHFWLEDFEITEVLVGNKQNLGDGQWLHEVLTINGKTVSRKVLREIDAVVPGYLPLGEILDDDVLC